MTNVELVKKFYSLSAAGDMATALSLFNPAIEWHECKGMPFVKDDGIYVGPEAIVKNVFMQLPVFFDGFNIAIKEIFGADDKAVMIGYYQGMNKTTGKPFKANATHVWTLKDGTMTQFFQAVDTDTINN